MKVIAYFEESQAVCSAFRELGHEAFSCDYGELGHLKEQHTGPTIEAVVHILKTKQSTL